MNEENVNHEAAENEAKVKKQFEKLKYSVKQLDRNNENRRPDFLISNSSGPQMLCEVKTINSAGCGVSTRNESLKDFQIPVDRI
jgi:DNA-binding sugar fermentation-stimulating protein